MTFWQKIATYIIAIFLSFGAGFLTAWLVKSCHKTTVPVISSQEREQIIQDARKGYITLDSAKALITSESKIKWTTIPRDSIRSIKDSINIIDSVIYIPVYEANDSIITLLDSLGYIVKVGLKQRFFPSQERFASSLWLSQFSAPKIKPKFSFRTYKKFRIGAGIGTRLKESFVYGKFSYYIINSSIFDFRADIKLEYNQNKILTPEVSGEIGVSF